MKKLTICFLLSMATFSAGAQPQKLEVEGSIEIGSSGGAPLAGMIRWTGLDFEGYNGTNWISLSGKQFGSVSDLDGHTYLTSKIGTQEWIIENLRASRSSQGFMLQKIEDNVQWGHAFVPAYCWYNNDSNTYERPYGKLHNQFVSRAMIVAS